MLEIVTEHNLHLGCRADDKSQVLVMLDETFKRQGYVIQDCLAFLVEREKTTSTFLGNGIVLPHLPPSARNIIAKTGVEIFQFPDGVIWDRGNVMFIAIGVIAKDKEHIDVLKEIASIFSDEIIAGALALISSKADFLRILKQYLP